MHAFRINLGIHHFALYGQYIAFIDKSASEKVRALIRSMKFLSSKVVLYPFKSGLAWNTVVISDVVLLIATC